MVPACLMVLVLLSTQSMGLCPRLVPPPAIHPAALGMVQSTIDAWGQAPATATKLFSNHHADTDCQLFDQLSHADGVTTALTMAVAVPVLSGLQRASHGLAVARWHALFQARGPPSFR